MHHKIILSIIIVFGVSLVVGATDLYLPSLPAMARYFNVSENKVQYSISAYLLGSTLGPLLYGILTDLKGRRVTFLTGFTLYTFASLICVLSPFLEGLLFGRFLQGLGGCAINIAGFAAIKDLYTKEQSAKIIAYHGMIISMAPAIAPVVGGYIEISYGWRINFVLILIWSILMLLFTFMNFKETINYRECLTKINPVTHYVAILKNKDFMASALIFPFLYGSSFCWITVAPFYFIETLGISPDTFGLYSMCGIMGYPFGAFLNSRLVSSIGLENTLFVGLLICFFACVLFMPVYSYFPHSPHFIIGVISLYTVGIGMCFATSNTLSMNVFKSSAGTTAATLHMLRMGTAGIGSYAGSLFNNDSLNPFITFFFLSNLLSWSFFLYIKCKQFRSRD